MVHNVPGYISRAVVANSVGAGGILSAKLKGAFTILLCDSLRFFNYFIYWTCSVTAD